MKKMKLILGIRISIVVLIGLAICFIFEVFNRIQTYENQSYNFKYYEVYLDSLVDELNNREEKVLPTFKYNAHYRYQDNIEILRHEYSHIVNTANSAMGKMNHIVMYRDFPLEINDSKNKLILTLAILGILLSVEVLRIVYSLKNKENEV